MKKSEMLNIISHSISRILDINPQSEKMLITSKFVLDNLEKAGMLPPINYKEREYSWESEDV